MLLEQCLQHTKVMVACGWHACVVSTELEAELLDVCDVVHSDHIHARRMRAARKMCWHAHSDSTKLGLSA